ncbi:MAG TPA: LptA/OstA family protein [Rhizobiaceae bacterium]|nr:LptA/OstA family protein [Rhizobiaceae bacterium]
MHVKTFPARAVSGAILGALLLSAPALAQSSGPRGLQLSGDQPVQIEGDRLDVLEDQGQAIFSGNVKVVQGSTLLQTEKLTIYYAQGSGGVSGGGDIEKLVANGKIYVRSGTQEATGDQGHFDMKSEVLTLTGKEVVLSDSGNVLVGCKLVVQMKTGKANFDASACGGRVSGVFVPGSRKN